MRYKKIQLIYRINCTLLEYREKTEKSIWKYPDFKKKCPICHGRNCAVRHGFYFRLIIDLKKRYFFFIRIIRYKCRRVQKPKNGLKDRTFSLLPHELIPYISLTIDSLMMIVENKLVTNNSTKEIQRILDGSMIDADRIYNMDSRHFNHYVSIFIETYFKLNQFLLKHNIRAGPRKGKISIKDAVIFLKQSEQGYQGFSVYYYETEGSWFKNAWFLFGRPYQIYSF